MADYFIKQFGGRLYPIRTQGGIGVSGMESYFSTTATNSGYLRTAKLGISAGGATPVIQELFGFTNPARYVSVGTGAAGTQFILTAGPLIAGDYGTNLSCTVTANSGSLTVTQVGLDITIQPAAAGSTAAAVVAAVNAFFTGTANQFLSAALPTGSAGGSNVTPSQAKRYFISDNRTP